MLRLYRQDPELLVWAFTRTEVLSALCKHARDASLSPRSFAEAKEKLELLQEDWTENIDYDGVRDRADRLLTTHALSAADALQLAAALIAVEEKPRGFSFVTLDARLGEAALAEGFSVIPLRR
jgi:predicted nucleic acid-binding protein